MEEVNAVNAIVGLNKQIEQLQSKLTSRKVENRQVRANLQLSQGFVDKLQAENEKLRKVIHEQGKCLASIKFNIGKA